MSDLLALKVFFLCKLHNWLYTIFRRWILGWLLFFGFSGLRIFIRPTFVGPTSYVKWVTKQTLANLSLILTEDEFVSVLQTTEHTTNSINFYFFQIANYEAKIKKFDIF